MLKTRFVLQLTPVLRTKALEHNPGNLEGLKRELPNLASASVRGRNEMQENATGLIPFL